MAGTRKSSDRPPTIRDVAELAGVSKSLVSLVLRNSPKVSDARRDAVEAAMEELNYRPNLQARALSRAKSDLVGVIINDLRNPWFVDLLDGLAKVLDKRGVESVLVDARTARNGGKRSIEMLLQRGVDGLAIVGGTFDRPIILEAAKSVPVVLMGGYESEVPGVDRVSDDGVEGGRLATQHLIDLGHRGIVHLRGPSGVGDMRMQGYLAAMMDAGLPTHVIAVDGSEFDAAESVRDLFAAPGRPTAVMAFNDVTAMGAMLAADDVGLRVPDDLSVIGYDNTYLSKIPHIAMTTVDAASVEAGERAARLLLERLADRDLPEREFVVPATLIERYTTGPGPFAPPELLEAADFMPIEVEEPVLVEYSDDPGEPVLYEYSQSPIESDR